MARVLLIDDEPIYYKMIVHALKPHGYEIEYAKTGMDGLKTVPLFKPDVVISDVRLPDLSGYDVAQRLRRDPRFESIPIIFLTSQADLSNKLKAFEVGADDYLSKPFQPEELVARIGILVRRGEALRSAVRHQEVVKDPAVIISVHSLRGGVGCTSTAVNLGMALYRLWEKPTLIVDTVLNAGQVALMLNASPVHTLEDLADLKPANVDSDLVQALISRHASGLNYIAAPAYPVAYDSFSDELLEAVLNELRNMFEFIVIDTSHDFSNVTINMLNSSDYILSMLSADMPSIRSAVCAYNIYDKLGYPSSKVCPMLTQLLVQPTIKQNQIEKVLKRPLKHVTLNATNEMNRSINFGEPLVATYTDSPITVMFEDMAYAMSKESLKNIPPAAPTAVWKRVTNRIASKK